MKAHSELRLVTCLFIDVVGSTDATVRLGPERMQRLLADAFAQLSGRIEAHGGVVEKYIGDAILGTFGIPISHPDDAARALRAAEACVGWASEWTASGGLSVRAGIETGDLLVDPRALGTLQRMVIGESINLAARLQSHAEPGQVVVGPGCHEATADLANFEPLGGLDLKGFGSVEAWRFTGFLEVGAASDIEFVGREDEIETLRAAFEAARQGSPRLALIVGPPGQGKSRLAREAIRRAGSFRVLEARCRPEAGENSPLRQLVEAEAGRSTADAVRGRIVGIVGPAEGGELAAAVCHSAGLAVDDSLLAIGRYEQRELIARAWERYLAAASSESPLCLLIEDLHWGDPVLLRVIDHVTSGSQGAVLGLATARPEFLLNAQLPARDGRVQLELEPLDEEAATRLAAKAGGDGDRLPASVERAAGNPLFLIELARVRLTGTRLPVTVQAAIAARLDELKPEDRELIQHASVAGEAFGIHDAVVLSDVEPAEVVAALGRVAQLGIVVPSGPDYRFHHALVRDVVYGRLPVTERMSLHARFAVHGVAGDVVAQAHHWWEALGPPDAAWVWSDKDRHVLMRRDAYHAHFAAGARLEDRNAYEDALTVYRRAVELAETTIERAVAEAEVGRLFARQGRGDEAWAHRLTALDLYAESGEAAPAKIYADMLELTAFNWGYFQQLPSDEEVLRLLGEGERVARASGDDVALARLLAERASYTEDMPGTDEFEVLLEAAPDPVPFADAAQRMATVYSWQGRIADAIALFERVFDDLVPKGAHINSPEALAWCGRAAFDAGDLAKADRLATALDADSLLRSVHTRSHYFSLVALIAFGRGDWLGLGRAAEAIHAMAEDNPELSFCVLSGACVGYAAASQVLAGGPLPDDLESQAHRQVEESEPVRAAIVLLPKVMVGQTEALDEGLAAYRPGVRLFDRIRVWDDLDVMPAIALTMLERWEQLSPMLARLHRLAGYGAALAGAVAEAIREEQLAAAGGAPARHDRLRGLGYLGISELLHFRPATTTRVAPPTRVA